MTTVLHIIRLLVIIQLSKITRCQDGFREQDILRFQQMANDGQVEAITSYSTNLFQRDPNSQSMSTANIQFQNDDKNNNNNFGRTLYSRSKKVYRIKNPFQNQGEDADKQGNPESQDSGAGASNQYASMQYSLPPEEFLQQLRADNQYYQQTQISTPPPNLGYTATPQPQYQYSTVSSLNYDNNHQNSQMQLEPKASNGATFLSSPSPYQYSTPNTYLDNVQSSPSPVPAYLSTPLNNGQISGTQLNSYVSSSSPIFLSSPTNLQSYVSSPFSVIQTGSPDYSNRITTTIGNIPNYDNNDSNKKMQIDHYDYSGNGLRYPNGQQQYQNEYVSTTTTTSPPSYSEQVRESWQINSNTNNAVSKSAQDGPYSQYQNYANNNNQQDTRLDSDSANSETHRIGNVAAANNLYVNYVQPDNQALNNMKIRTRDINHETGQQDLYSNGDFGWKLTGKKPLIDVFPQGSYQRYPQMSMSSEGPAVSQMNFHMDTSKRYGYEPVSKSATENIEAQEFAKAAANAHERMKQHQQQQQQQQQFQQQQHQQLQQYYGNNDNYASSNIGNHDTNTGNVYFTNNDKQKSKYSDNSNAYYYGSSQNDVVTASPYFISNTRDNSENKPKQPFDHDKALKNIVPIDVSNVVGNSDSSSKSQSGSDSATRFLSTNYGKDQTDSNNYKQYTRPITDSFYKDKNSLYGFNIKTKGDEYLSTDSLKQLESNLYNKQTQGTSYNPGSFSGSSQGYSYLSQPLNPYQDNIQSSSIQQAGFQRNQNQLPSDIASILKFEDIPYKLTQNFPSDALKLHNLNFDQGGIPTPLPIRLNQNVGSHQLDVTTSLLNKLLLNKQPTLNLNRPELDSQSGGLLSTINGFKVANPFNMDLKLVAEMLKGKQTVDDSHMISLRDQYAKPSPLKLDLSQLQLLLKNENAGNIAPINEGLSALGGSYLDLYNNGRYPYQGVKYSRSQEEEESIIPIADASSTHPIGAVIEQDDSASESEVNAATDLTGQGEDIMSSNYDDSRPKNMYVSSTRLAERHKHPNMLMSGRHSYQRKYPKSDAGEPYPLLKPPPPHSHVGRSSHVTKEKLHRRRRINKPKMIRVFKTEPLFEAGAEPESMEKSVPILLRPPPPVAESKSDTVSTDDAT